LARLSRTPDDDDQTNEIGTAWAVKERLRMLLAKSEPSKNRRPADFADENDIDPSCPKPPD
jgi:hypothetical protein